jgi:hypothetical protein
VATPEHVEEAFRLFNVSTVDAARSGINEHLNLSPEIANEIKVSICIPGYTKFSYWTLHFPERLSSFFFHLTASGGTNKEKNGHRQPHIRATADWWSKPDGDEWIHRRNPVIES